MSKYSYVKLNNRALIFMQITILLRTCIFMHVRLRKIMEEMKVLEKGGSLVTGEQEVLKSKTVYSRLPTIDSTQ